MQGRTLVLRSRAWASAGLAAAMSLASFGHADDLAALAIGRHQGRSGTGEITLFESQGMAIQDLAVALRVLEAAQAQGLGETLPMQ